MWILFYKPDTENVPELVHLGENCNVEIEIKHSVTLSVKGSVHGGIVLFKGVRNTSRDDLPEAKALLHRIVTALKNREPFLDLTA